ncbi:hypothetical protein HDV05_005394 [Chytridiales sp. JEL 0842]|nr:hypothetical protein HDV05_005394 [Chytridiales sp. JEL 0842]
MVTPITPLKSRVKGFWDMNIHPKTPPRFLKLTGGMRFIPVVGNAEDLPASLTTSLLPTPSPTDSITPSPTPTNTPQPPPSTPSSGLQTSSIIFITLGTITGLAALLFGFLYFTRLLRARRNVYEAKEPLAPPLNIDNIYPVRPKPTENASMASGGGGGGGGTQSPTTSHVNVQFANEPVDSRYGVMPPSAGVQSWYMNPFSFFVVDPTTTHQQAQMYEQVYHQQQQNALPPQPTAQERPLSGMTHLSAASSQTPLLSREASASLDVAPTLPPKETPTTFIVYPTIQTVATMGDTLPPQPSSISIENNDNKEAPEYATLLRNYEHSMSSLDRNETIQETLGTQVDAVRRESTQVEAWDPYSTEDKEAAGDGEPYEEG